MKISILHPTRNRVIKSLQTINHWLNSASGEVELIVSVDSDDPALSAYQESYHAHKLIINPNRSAIDAINNAAKVATGDIFIVVSDDTDCPLYWDNTIWEAVIGKQDFVLRVADGIQKWIVTMPCLDRAYYNRFGYIYHHSYTHMFADTELTHVADGLKRIIWRDDIVFPHNHYSLKPKNEREYDETTLKAETTVNSGREVYLKRVKRGFDIPGFDIWDLNERADRSGHRVWMQKHLR